MPDPGMPATKIVRVPLGQTEWVALRRLFLKTFRRTVRDPKKFGQFVEIAFSGIARELLKGRTITIKRLIDIVHTLAQQAGILENVAKDEHGKHEEEFSKETPPE